MPSSIGIYIIFVGIGLIVIGALVWSGALSWVGNLPGDIRIERGQTKIYIPITSYKKNQRDKTAKNSLTNWQIIAQIDSTRIIS